MFWFIVLLLLAGGGFYVYSKLREMERQIRAEQEREKELAQQQSVVATETTAPAAQQDASPMAATATVPAAASTAADTDEQKILAAVQRQPGIVQSELYALLPAMSKRQQQQLIKQLADDGKLKRKAHRSSYQLYPA